MTSTRMREVLNLLHWTQHTLSDVLQCSDRLVRMWASNKAPVPESIDAWLEGLAAAHKALPPPSDFRRISGPKPRASAYGSAAE